MGSIADEMKKVLQMWDAEDQTQPEETKVVNTTETKAGQQSITDRLMAVIQSNPGITGIELREKLSVLHPDIPTGFTSSMLKQFTDRCYVTRTISPVRVDGRSVYAYTAVPESERKAMRNKLKEDHEKAVARAAHARAVKEQKKAEKQSKKEIQGGTFVPYEKKSISDVLGNYEPVNTKPAEWNPNDTIDSLTVKQARALYNALKEVFGGA